MAVVDEEYTFLTWRAVADELADALRLPALSASWYDATKKYQALAADDKESNLIHHAITELTLAGWYDEKEGDKPFADSLVAAVSEFSHYGHSGGSAPIATSMLETLLRFKPLSSITSNPEEWMSVAEYFDGISVWQCKRQGDLLSYDQGKTWYSVEDPRWRNRWSPRAALWRRKWRKQLERVRTAS